MATFTANGLLGSNTTHVAINPKDAAPTAFLPDSLQEIQTIFSMDDLDTNDNESSTSRLLFRQNGLLGSNATNIYSGDTVLSALNTTSTISSISTLHDPIQPSSFPIFRSNGLLPESQDDDIPPVSEAYGIHPHNNQPSRYSTSISAPRTSVRATTFDGKSIFMRKRTKRTPNFQKTVGSSFSTGIGSLLETPIHRLMDGLSRNTAIQLEQSDRTARTPTIDETKEVEDCLWVDRYKPQRFTELMGNERVARETMAWVKQWDWCVFGKRGKKRVRDGEENIELEDEYHRPRQRLLLLSGPPGLGKTTLAHVVASQAGYEVMEINASDARSGQIVDDRIRPALEAGCKVGSSKPVLLVIDEIDGATGAGESSNTFIHKLVQLMLDKPKAKYRSGQKKPPNTKRPILRPIICICNDHNASSLVKLRLHALQIRFTRPADVHSVKRLKEICELEDLNADFRALGTLVAVARGDLRGCLNALQFIKSRNEAVTEAVIRSATVGMKQADTSVLSVLNNLFNPLSKRRVKELAMSEDDEGRYSVRLSQEVEASGRQNAIATGCFAHYATLRRHDASFTRYEKANEWLVTFDLFSAAMYTDGDFALNQYIPYTLVPFHPLFQERGGLRVERDQADWEHLQVLRSNEEIYKSFSRCLRTATLRHGADFRHLVSTPIMQLEFAPYINRIISPPLRPVNSQIIRPEERALLGRLVDIMACLELRFVQERGEDGQLTYRLDPPIDVFITYDSKRATDIALSRYAVRRLVAEEIDARLNSRDNDVVDKGKRGKHDFFGYKPVLGAELEFPPAASQPLDDATSEHPNKRTKLDLRDIADRPPTDFFGRLITEPSVSTTKAAARKNIERKYRVSYRYTEGNSAAVRKPVKVGKFL